MPLNFPDNPQQNDTFTVNGRTYTYRGNRWRRTKAKVADVSPTLEIANDFTAGSALKVDADNSSVGIGTMTPNINDALTVGGHTTVTGNLNVGGTLDVTGVISAPTALHSVNDTTVATTAYVTTAISNLIGGAPSALDTLNELAAALDDDASYAATITNALALKLDSSSYTASDVLAKIKTVDGASSGLDADTLDGSHASAFAASSHTHSYAATNHTHSYLPLSGGTLTGNLSLRSANGAHDSIYRVGGIYFTWDSDSYGTNADHSIRSTNGDTWSDDITINSYGNVRVNIDSNGNGSNTFSIGRYTTGTGNTLLTLDESGNLSVTGDVTAQDNMYVGSSGSGDSWIHFHDDNSNTWRTFGWDDSANEFYGEGGLRLTGVLDLEGTSAHISFADVSDMVMQWGDYNLFWNSNYKYLQARLNSTQKIVLAVQEGWVYAGRFYQTGGGSTYNWSDERLKRNITDYSGGLSVLRQLRPVEYNWDCDRIDDGTKREIGLIAQEVQPVHPEWVDIYSKEPHVRTSDGEVVEDVLALGFGNDFNVMVISALQELADRVEALESA